MKHYLLRFLSCFILLLFLSNCNDSSSDDAPAETTSQEETSETTENDDSSSSSTSSTSTTTPAPSTPNTTSSPPVDIEGSSWSGVYYRTDESARESITANINQDNEAITLSTTRSSTPGQHLTGSIDSDGNMKLTDSSDGEIWTTHFGPASRNSIKIADFIHVPVADEDNPLYVIELSR